MSAIAYSTVDHSLRRAVPEFGDAIDRHAADNGEVLPHLLFGDLTRFVLRARTDGDDELVSRCLAFLDLALSDGDPEVQNLVAVSFVENVAFDAPFIQSWPEALRHEAEQQRKRPEGSA